VKIKNIKIDDRISRVSLAAAAVVLIAFHWYIVKWSFGNMVSTRAEQPEVADFAVALAPDDPQTHYAAAVLYDRTFLASDQQRSLDEYEHAAALAPGNYLLWLEYGKALGRSGNFEASESALRQALKLAPNYSVVQWTLGNLLVRRGNENEGFEQIRRAIAGNDSYAPPAVSFAYEYFSGNIEKVRETVGSSPAASAALALSLARAKRFDEAADVWSSIPEVARDASILLAGRSLTNEMISAKRFHLAIRVSEVSGSMAGQVRDGGFEDEIKLENAGPFEWQIDPGTQPQPLQSTSQPHSGSRCLVLRFASSDGNGLRQMSQTVVVTPGQKYVFGGFFRSDVRSDSTPAFLIVDATNGNVLSEVRLNTPSDVWKQFSTDVVVPAGTDGIILRFTVKKCASSICPINGSIWLDDLALTPDAR
jgi:Tfp pilus assembly protein PilF